VCFNDSGCSDAAAAAAAAVQFCNCGRYKTACHACCPVLQQHQTAYSMVRRVTGTYTGAAHGMRTGCSCMGGSWPIPAGSAADQRLPVLLAVTTVTLCLFLVIVVAMMQQILQRIHCSVADVDTAPSTATKRAGYERTPRMRTDTTQRFERDRGLGTDFCYPLTPKNARSLLWLYIRSRRLPSQALVRTVSA
jgi:hypothetical protein